jgi:hypothetical protein
MGLTECRFLILSSFSMLNTSLRRDIDFEYPANEAEGWDFLDLVTSVRNAFDELSTANGDTTPYELTVSSDFAYATWITTRFLGRSVGGIPELCILSSPAVGPRSHLLEFDGRAVLVLSAALWADSLLARHTTMLDLG